MNMLNATTTTTTTNVNDKSRRSKVRLAVECRTRPTFQCPECYEDVLAEQESVFATLEQIYPMARIVASTHQLLNMLFVEVPLYDTDHSQDLPRRTQNKNVDTIVRTIRTLPRVVHVFMSSDWELATSFLPPALDAPVNASVSTAARLTNDTSGTATLYAKPLRDVGVDVAAREYCGATGHGVRVAIADGGIDYTHAALGGAGTVPAFQAAFGTSLDDERNRQRDSMFPTSVVTEGRDFLGDVYRDGDASWGAAPDDDPIDLTGHGTAVAHAVRAMAPHAELVAIKICATRGNTCPDFAFVQGMEYSLDPNQDGNRDDAVHIVNLSLGRMYASNYYSVLARATEELMGLGVLPVLAAGNNGNLPYVLGGAPATPNALTVGATVVVEEGNDNPHSFRTMASYSSRGPGESNVAKPDLVAPGGPYGLAKASTGDQYFSFQGTSFAAPLVAGAAALVKQKCPECSPLAIMALIMNHATPTVRYSSAKNATAPVTLQGAGELQIHRSLAATFWAYCTETRHPSISLGLVRASKTVTLQRTIRIVKLIDAPETLQLGYSFRSDAAHHAVTIRFLPNNDTVTLDGACQQEFVITVEFAIDAARAPSNHLSSSGKAGNDPGNLDWNEVDGWILLTRTDSVHQVSIPFHMVLQKSAEITIETTTYNSQTLDLSNLPASIPVNLRNVGAETAQIDIFQLLYAGDDVPESDYGLNSPPADLRYVGYRVVANHDDHDDHGDAPGCEHLVEFAVVTWESQSTIAYTHFNVWIDVDFDGTSEHTIFNAGYRLGSALNEMRRINLTDGIEYCLKYPPDHATNTANTILRFCTDDIGLTYSGAGVVSVAVSAYSFPEIDVLDVMQYQNISIPMAGLSAPSYNVEPMATLEEIIVSGTGTTPNGVDPLGLLLITNSYRSPASTGSSTRASEVIVITPDDTRLPQEITSDILEYPVLEDTQGPSCSWELALTSCFGRTLRDQAARVAQTTIASNDKVAGVERLIQEFDARFLQTQCPDFPLNRPNATTIERNPTLM
jgi:subtilisin family serine protease